MSDFVNRDRELKRLAEAYDSSDPELVVIYGRRRMGKTELIKQSLVGRNDTVHALAIQATKQIQLDSVVDRAAETYPGATRIQRDWEPLLGYLAEQDAVIVLDEFPYLVEADESLPSVIQRLWDTEFQETDMTLVLIGSSISMMEDAIFSGSSPLYGRLTVKLDLTQLPFSAAMQFFPNYTSEKQVCAWGIYGGTPRYLEVIDDTKPLGDNIRDTILPPEGDLMEEPDYILRTELTEPNTYFAILKAIAAGNRKANKIAQTVGIETPGLSYYTDRLRRLRLIKRDIPVTAEPTKSRRGRYRLLDSLFRFWFRFVYGYEDRYEYLDDPYNDLIAVEIADFVSPAFERLCQTATARFYDEETFENIGRWWYKQHEVDVVGLTTGSTLIAGECKFTSSTLGYSTLRGLEQAATNIDWTPQQGGTPDMEYALFSRSGFSDSVTEAAAERDDLRLFTLDDVIAALP
jgi:AAA+ ATPase superfamily predicted ATPase